MTVVSFEISVKFTVRTSIHETIQLARSATSYDKPGHREELGGTHERTHEVSVSNRDEKREKEKKRNNQTGENCASENREEIKTGASARSVSSHLRSIPRTSAANHIPNVQLSDERRARGE